MGNIDKAILQVEATSAASHTGCSTDGRALLVVTIAYILAVLSIPVTDPASMLWMFVYPIVMSEALGIGYGRIFVKSLWILPLLVMIGIFNPLFDKVAELRVGWLVINRGWFTFAALVLRGLLAFQSLLLLISTCGFFDICRALQYMKVPKVLVTQLVLLYRYIGVLLREAQSMQRARTARGYGRRSYPLKMWAMFTGQLFIRSINRAGRVNAAMIARGFNGVYRFAPYTQKFRLADWCFMLGWICLFGVLRYVDFTSLIGRLIVR